VGFDSRSSIFGFAPDLRENPPDVLAKTPRPDPGNSPLALEGLFSHHALENFSDSGECLPKMSVFCSWYFLNMRPVWMHPRKTLAGNRPLPGKQVASLPLTGGLAAELTHGQGYELRR
jgi:hypothetical protein